jgi:glycosyltransferase involved in cell wall biosynthesis
MTTDNKPNRRRILILCPSPRGTAPTQRLKYEQYLTRLEKEGYSFTISSFQTSRFWKIIYQPGRVPEKIFWTLFGYTKRVYDLLRAPFYDGVFVNLWVTPIGFPVYERVLFFFNKNVIYDIDDMIFLSKSEPTLDSGFIQKIKGKRKPLVLMKHAKHIIVCTPKLEEIAIEQNKFKRAIDISSTFDTDRFVPVNEYKQTETTIIGWTGTHSTITFLETIQPALAEVAKCRNIKLVVIANTPYEMPGVETEYIQWRQQTEVYDLHRFQIGLYPIPANEWSLGKSGLKALTYMAIAIPFVATAYGANFRIMEDGVQGYLANDIEEWTNKLCALIDDVELRKKMGKEGRKRVEEKYSIETNFSKYLQVFQTVVPLGNEKK